VAGTATITGTLNAVAITDTATVDLEPAPPAKVVFIAQPSDTNSTEVISPAIRVQVQDSNNNLVTGNIDFITLDFGTNAGTPAGTLSGTLTVAAVGGEATFSDISIDKAGVGYTLTASSGGLTPALSGAFEIKVGAPAQLVYSVEPSNADATLTISPAIKVQVLDAGGNRVTTSADSISLAIGTNAGTPAGTLSGTITKAAVSGEATFSDISIDKVGIGYTLVADASGLSPAISTAFTINVGAPTQLAFIGQPTNAESTEAISTVSLNPSGPPLRVQVQDAGSNLVATATDSVIMSIGNNAGATSAGTLSGTLTVAAVNGEVTFSDISIDKIGSGYTLRVASGTLASDTSSAFNILLGPPALLAFIVQPSTAQIGAAISPAVKVQVQDAGENFNDSATNSITLVIGTNPGSTTLSGTTNGAAVSGEVFFSDISIDTVGNGYTLVASAAGLTAAISNPFNITDSVVAGIAGISADIAAVSSVIDSIALDTSTTVQTTANLEADVAVIKQDTASIKIDTGTTLQARLEALESTVVSILEDTSTTIPQTLKSVETEVQDSAKSAKILNRPTTTKRGEPTSIQFQTDSGLSPVLNLYDPDNELQVTNATMTEIGTTGVYEYELSIDDDLPLGDYTIIVTERTKGSLDSMNLTVSDSDLSDLADIQDAATQAQSQASTAASSATAAQKLIEQVKAQILALDQGGPGSTIDLMTKLQEALNSIRDAVLGPQEGIEGGLAPIQTTISEISELLKQVSSENGVNLDTMYDSIDETTTEVAEVKDKVERLRVMLETNREIAEKVLERAPPKKAVIKTWFEAG
jgi:hypothetical protein